MLPEDFLYPPSDWEDARIRVQLRERLFEPCTRRGFEPIVLLGRGAVTCSLAKKSGSHGSCQELFDLELAC